MKRFLRVLVCAAVVVMAVVVAPPARADSVGGIKDFGWWTKRPGAQPTPNGFEIANGPDGEESVAAFHLDLTGSVSQAVVKFTESTDPNVAMVSGTPTVKVCTTTSSWTAEQQGTFDKAPKEDCSQSVKMTVDKTTWTADVTPLVTGKTGEVSLMAVPDVAAGAVVQPSFNRQFGAPLAQTDGTPGTPSTSVSSAYAPPTVPRPQGAVSSPTPVPSPPSIPKSTPAATVPTTPASTPAAPPSSVSPQQVTIGVAHPTHKEWGRMLLYVPLAAVVGVALVLARKSMLERGLVSPT